MPPLILEPAGKLCSSVVLGDVIWMPAVKTRLPDAVCWTGMVAGGGVGAAPVINMVADDVACARPPDGVDIMEAPI